MTSVKKVLAAGERSLSAWSKIENDDREDHVPSLVSVLGVAASLARSLRQTRKELRRLQSAHDALQVQHGATSTPPVESTGLSEVVVPRGATFTIATFGSTRLQRIAQVRYDNFRLIFDDGEPATVVDTGGFHRTGDEGARANIPSLKLKVGDVITMPGWQPLQIASMVAAGQGLFRVTLEAKHVATVDIDIAIPGM